MDEAEWNNDKAWPPAFRAAIASLAGAARGALESGERIEAGGQILALAKADPKRAMALASDLLSEPGALAQMASADWDAGPTSLGSAVGLALWGVSKMELDGGLGFGRDWRVKAVKDSSTAGAGNVNAVWWAEFDAELSKGAGDVERAIHNMVGDIVEVENERQDGQAFFDRAATGGRSISLARALEMCAEAIAIPEEADDGLDVMSFAARLESELAAEEIAHGMGGAERVPSGSAPRL